MTEQLSLFEYQTLDGKVKRSIEIIRLASEMSEQYYGKPIIVCYSGGKDSDVLLDLVKRAGVPFEVIHSLTTVDAPPTVQHVKEIFKELNAQGTKATIKKPMYKGEPITMWKLIPIKRIPPTRTARYCCTVLKEASTPNRLAVLGVRRAESTNRAGRKEFELRGATKNGAPRYDFEHVLENYGFSQEHAGEENAEVWDCKIISSAKNNREIMCNPIVSWEDADVLDYAKERKIKMNPLYSMGYTRVGCVGCHMASQGGQEKEFADFPAYRKNYVKAFDRMLDERRADGLPTEWANGEEVMEWWTCRREGRQLEGQESFFEGG